MDVDPTTKYCTVCSLHRVAQSEYIHSYMLIEARVLWSLIQCRGFQNLGCVEVYFSASRVRPALLYTSYQPYHAPEETTVSR